MNRSRFGSGGRSQDRTADSYRVKVIQESAKPGVDSEDFQDLGERPQAGRRPRVARIGVLAALLLGAACLGTVPPPPTGPRAPALVVPRGRPLAPGMVSTEQALAAARAAAR